MKKKIFLMLFMAVLLVCAFTISISAKEAYVERVPSHLVDDGEELEYFIVLDGEEYFGASGSTLDSLNSGNIESALDALVGKGEYPDARTALGTKYMIKFVFPAKMGDTQITYVYLNNNALKGNTYFKDYCGAIVYASTHTKTGDANERNKKIRSIDFGENSQIKEIPFYYMNGASALRELKNFPQSLDLIAESAFANCNIHGVLYVNATTVKRKAFDCGIQNVSGIVIGERTVNIETEAFSARGGTNQTKFIEFKGDITKMNIVASEDNLGPFYFKSGTQRNPFDKVVCLILSHPSNQALITEGITTFQDILPNVYFNEQSKNGGNPVKKGHNNELTLSYESFDKYGTRSGVCKDCGSESSYVEKVAPLFVCLGYSASESGNAGLILSFKVNHEAIENYKTETGNGLEYGMFAVLKSSIGENGILNADGSENAGVIKADLTKNQFTVVSIKVKGFTNDEQKSAQIALGLYVIVDGEEKEISYCQSGTPEEGEKFTSTSYNEQAPVAE
ncbi:MAG: leucine-rich repeat protein [Clostridia bacterium]|nr:leucine-rich repeat protein [Clostridia bacterium]